MALGMVIQVEPVLEDTDTQLDRDMEVTGSREDRDMATREVQDMDSKALPVTELMVIREHRALADMDSSLHRGPKGIDHKVDNIIRKGSKTARSFCFSILITG